MSRPFSPNLLCQGDLIGPRTLLEVHRQTLTLEEATARFEQEAKQRKRHPEVQLACRLCSFLQPGQEKLKPLHAFLDSPDACRLSVVAQGMDRVCRACRSLRSASQPQPADGKSTPCAWCQKTLLAEPGFCKVCQQKPLACAKCDAAQKKTKRKLADFSVEEILRRKRTKELRRARCKKCVAAAPARATKAGKCTQCGQWKCRTNFFAFVEATNEGVCRQCHVQASKLPEQAQTKKCPQCGKALHKLATPGSWCDSCAFPPCQAGCGNTRPRKSSYHAKNRPSWVCSKCAGMCSACGDDLPARAKRDTWCDSCAFPPCQGGCGQARPRKSELHARSYPNWTCNACAANKCVKCGQDLPEKAHVDTWCSSCAFPPCQGGCGKARPQKSELHAKRCPSWTCNACALNQCAKCGQDLPKKANVDTWCSSCAFPPYQGGCGQPRPQTEPIYHAKRMPSWSCQRCAKKQGETRERKRCKRGGSQEQAHTA